jgi:ABC-2 type transport system ATP-binding protein
MPAPKSASVRIRDLAKRYGTVEALRGASFEVNAGEIFGLLGPNGAGKTTALECLLGLRRPDAGAIRIGDVDARESPQEAKRLVGAQIQGATLQDRITPRRALELFASFYADPTDVGELLSGFGLTAKAHSPFGTLSSGQKQRLFLALAFVNNPSVVVLDEPTSGLDPRSRRELHDVIAGMRESGRTVLLSTHDLHEAQRLCDRIGILDQGRIVGTASPAEFIARFGSKPAITVRMRPSPDFAQLRSLPGVDECRPEGDGWRLTTNNVGATIPALTRLLESGGMKLTDLRLEGPSLEDAFLGLTGRPWSDSPPEDA